MYEPFVIHTYASDFNLNPYYATAYWITLREPEEDTFERRKIDKTHRKQCKMSSSKKMTCKGTLRQVFICLFPRTSYPPPPPIHTVCVYTVYLFTREGGDLNQREGERGNSSQSWVENTNITDCISSLLALINTYPKVPFHVSFLDDDILLPYLYG